MSQPKVFEFAKEVGLAPLALMDKIREWGLPIKSHMAELTVEQVDQIKDKLGLNSKATDSAPKPKAKKKVATRKKVTESATVVVVKSSKASKAVDDEAKVVKADETVPTTRVVRRRKESLQEEPSLATNQDMGVESSSEVEAQALRVTAADPAETASPLLSDDKDEKVAKADSVIISDTAAEAPAQAASVTLSTENKVSAQAVEESNPVTPVSSEESVKASVTLEASPVTAAPSVAPSPVARKKEVTIGQSGVASQPSAAATQVRRNIVGRMDLSRVQGMGGHSSSGGGGYQGRQGASGGAGGTGRPPLGGSAGAGPNRGKTNIRAGFVSMPQFNVPTPEDDSAEVRLREERRREREKAREGAAAKEAGDAPPEFDASEFKKRELVFQPKKKTNMLTRPAKKTQVTQAAAHKRLLKVEGAMKLGDVATSIGVKTAELTKVLMKNGIMATPGTSIDFETLALILPDFGWEVQNVLKSPEELIEEMAFGNLQAEPVLRAPVVTIMGHVDHGKTSLLDSIRKANVASGEAGGITQHIGAYQVELEDGYRITFLDTPGHEAFTAMRARGANVTDIAIIVVAADDGMMPQTAEAISHAKAAGVPIIVAVNKMDKPGANPDRVMQQLTELQIVPEEWGGDTIYCKVSALTKEGIPELLEQIRLVAEVAELKANPERSATGLVIEAKLDKGRGPVATLLIKDGSVSVGQWIVAGIQKGRVRSLTNDRGERITIAGPGQPVELLGLDGTPSPGDRFDVVKDEAVLDRVIELRQMIIEQQKVASKKATLEEIFAKVKAGDVRELNVVVKADVHGSLEALLGMMQKLGNEEVKLKVVHSAVGGVTESDVLLASTARGIIIGFNVRPDNKAAQLAKNNGIEVRSYSIVYELMDDLKKALAGLLAPSIVENVLGRAEVRNTFTVPKIGTIAGCFVLDGKVARGSMLRLIRDGKIVYEGKLSSLKRFKDDAKEVAAGYECGIGIENFNDIKNGDTIEAYVKEEVIRELVSTASPASV